MADSGLLVLSSFISPFRSERSRVRQLHDAADLPFLEIFVDVPLDVAESRDPKVCIERHVPAKFQISPEFISLTRREL